MISSKDFDHFLKHGFVEGLSAGSPMKNLLDVFGTDCWIAKDTELNGLVYGIIKIGFIEFHIYNEKINGISYRPDMGFSKGDFKGVDIPWVYKKKGIKEIERELSKREIQFKKYTVIGPLKKFKTAGAWLIGLENTEHIFIDTEGGATFLFADGNEQLEAYQICKYYDIHRIDQITTA